MQKHEDKTGKIDELEAEIGQTVEHFHMVDELIDKLKGEKSKIDGALKEMKGSFQRESEICSNIIHYGDEYASSLAHKCYLKLQISKVEKERAKNNKELSQTILRRKSLLSKLEKLAQVVFDVECKKGKENVHARLSTKQHVVSEEHVPTEETSSTRKKLFQSKESAAKVGVIADKCVPSTSGFVAKKGLSVKSSVIQSSSARNGSPNFVKKEANVYADQCQPSTSGFVSHNRLSLHLAPESSKKFLNSDKEEIGSAKANKSIEKKDDLFESFLEEDESMFLELIANEEKGKVCESSKIKTEGASTSDGRKEKSEVRQSIGVVDPMMENLWEEDDKFLLDIIEKEEQGNK